MKKIWIIAKREFLSYFNSMVALISIVLFVASLNAMFMRMLFIENQASMRSFFGLLPWFYLFLIPSLTMKQWAEEKRMGTFEMLLTLPVNNYQLVIGKFLAAWGVVCLALGLTAIVPLTLPLVGNPDFGSIIGGYFGAIFLGGAMVAVGLFSSALTINQVNSFVIASFISFGLIIIGEQFVLSAVPLTWAKVFSVFGLISHFQDLAKGVLDFRDIFYYLSIIFFFLYLNYHTLEIRKWKQ